MYLPLDLSVRDFSSHRAWTFILQSLRLPFNLCTSSEEIYFRNVFSLFLPDSPSTVPTHLRHRICLKYSHCHHRNHLYNPHIKRHYPESSPQGLASNLEVILMTETEFFHLQRRLFPTPFCLFFFARSPRNIHARVSRAMEQFFLKIAHSSFSMGPTPLLKMVFSYGLRPRLWLLAVRRIVYP